MSNPIVDPFVEGPDTDAQSSLVRIEGTVSGAVTVTLNRPGRRNALDGALIAALDEAFRTLHGAEGVRVVFLRGAGGTFCAGGDLEWVRSALDGGEGDLRDNAQQLAQMFKALRDIPALTVALVEGAAFGGGAGLVAACDTAMATAQARFSFSEARLGLVSAVPAPYVVEALGARRARALFASARTFDAVYAEKIGLIDEVAADAAALAAAQGRIAGEAVACAPGAIGEAKRLINDVSGRDLEHGLIEETVRRMTAAWSSAEGQEGVAAFLAKRKPSWAES